MLGTSDNSLGAIAGSSPSVIWAVGDYLPDAANSNQDATLAFAEHYDGHSWSVVRPLNTGVSFNSFYGVAATGGEAWAVGEYLNAAYQDRALLRGLEWPEMVYRGHPRSLDRSGTCCSGPRPFRPPTSRPSATRRVPAGGSRRSPNTGTVTPGR